MVTRIGVTLPGSWGVNKGNPAMEITVGMFAQICVIILSACAASLTLLDWHLSKKTVRTSARAVDMKGDRVFAQPDKPFVLDTAAFILAEEDIRRVADVDEVLRRVRRDVSEKTDGEVVDPKGPLRFEGCEDAARQVG